MKTLFTFLWLFCFIPLAIVVQGFVPGVDVLVVALIILLQEKEYVFSAWVMLLFVLLQEGMGTLAFGGAVLWYGGLFLLFFCGKIFFEARNVFFLLLFSIVLGIMHVLLLLMLAPLQNLTLNVPTLLHEAFMQALCILLLWFPMVWLRRRMLRYANAA